ncbi:MAG TPA: hypothetical protein VN455_14065 [Methanotrichaceae archaeon]|nr:hypothetical protein [Methanotrichaceae archaeon]
MRSCKKAIFLLICLPAIVSAAGAIELKSTGTNSITGTAVAEGDTFTLTSSDSGDYIIYSGVWAHAFVPAGNDGVNAADSQRTVPARDEEWSFSDGSTDYMLTTGYGPSIVTAKASKTGTLGFAEAFSEVSSVSNAAGTVYGGSALGQAQLTAFLTHTGTGTANASANGPSSSLAMITGSGDALQASGSADGSVSLNASNIYGGSVVGAAFMSSSGIAVPYIGLSDSYEYLYLESGRTSLSALSAIDGNLSGGVSANGLQALSAEPGIYGNFGSSASGNLHGDAVTYKLGDSIIPAGFSRQSLSIPSPSQLDAEIGDKDKTSITESLYDSFFGANKPRASAYLGSNSLDFLGFSYTVVESFTSSSVTRTLEDARETHGASYIDNGALFATNDMASQAGKSPITFASSSVEGIHMGSGGHLTSRLAGASPQSAADLVISSSISSSGDGIIDVNGGASGSIDNVLVTSVGPAYSPSGTSADATGSYLTAKKISGTAVHTMDEAFAPEDSVLMADDIGEINIWSWISGDDPRPHCESRYGLYPYVSTPIYTSDPAGVAGETEGPAVTSRATAASRSVDAVFGSLMANI